jgi:diguanylate cyclase (GGDEF)-like protein
MELTQEILLPVLLAAIVANTVILVLVVLAARLSRRDRVSPGATRSVLQGSLMSTSYVDRSGSSPWMTNGDAARDAGGEAAPGDDGGPEQPLDPEAGAEGATDGPSDPDTDGDLAAPVTDAGGADADGEAEPPSEPGPESASVNALSGIDPLTGLLDHSTFTRLIVAEDVRIRRYHRPATVVIFEVDGLDRLVDRLGPDAGDRVLPALSDTMRRLARGVDHVARLGPSRFGVLLPETDEVAAINYVERVRRACELWLESGAIALGLAVGWAGTDGEPTLVEAQRLATERMYVELRRDARRSADR